MRKEEQRGYEDALAWAKGKSREEIEKQIAKVKKDLSFFDLVMLKHAEVERDNEFWLNYFYLRGWLEGLKRSRK